MTSRAVEAVHPTSSPKPSPMQIFRAPLAVLALLVLLTPAVAAQQTPASGIDALFNRFAGLDTPGCAVGVARGGEIEARAYGAAALEHGIPNRPETIFEAGSVSKQFTAAATLLLVQDGRISLDDDVRTYIPELPDYGEPITIRHLITHTSGLRDWGSVTSLEGWPRGSRVHDHEHMLAIAARQASLNYAPGEYYSYTNTGYNLQAVIVERVTGMSFADFSRTRIFEPLGLTNTQWRDDYTRIVPGRAAAYSRRGNGYRLNMPFENVHGNGGLLTTVGDLLRWTDLLARGAIAGPEFTREMQRQMRLTSGREIEYASGLFITSHRGIDEISHSGSTAGYRAYLARYPDHELAVAVLCNAGDAGAAGLARGVADLFLPEGGPAGEYAGVEVPSARLAERAGLYRDERRGRPLRITFRDGVLRAGNTTMVPLSHQRFRAGSAVLEFDPAGGFRWAAADGDTLVYAAVSEFVPGPQELSEYAGRYASEEAEATYTIAVEGDHLTLQRRFGSASRLEPAYEDAFTGAGMVIRFVRDADGRVVAASSVTDRVWDMRFDRLD